MSLWVKTRADSQQNGDVLSRSTAHEEFTKQLRDYYVLEQDFASGTYVH